MQSKRCLEFSIDRYIHILGIGLTPKASKITWQVLSLWPFSVSDLSNRVASKNSV